MMEIAIKVRHCNHDLKIVEMLNAGNIEPDTEVCNVA
jgi:hypothetical protein